jgi:DNA polymerase-3 subunit epsilon
MTKRAIFYDTETTGVKPNSDRIIELAAYDATLEKTYVQLINPKIPIPKTSTDICHITDDMVKDAPPFSEIAKDFLDFCGDDCFLIAHNNDNFDKPFLEAEFARNNVTFPELSYLDSLKWARKYRNDLPRHSLQYLREVYGFEENQAHRALDDVIILHKVFKSMIGDLSFEKAFELMQNNQQNMPFGKHKGKPLQEIPKHYVKWLNENGVFDKDENKSLKAGFVKLGILEKTAN